MVVVGAVTVGRTAEGVIVDGTAVVVVTLEESAYGVN